MGQPLSYTASHRIKSKTKLYRIEKDESSEAKGKWDNQFRKADQKQDNLRNL